MTEKLTCGVLHFGLTVPDLDLARAFICGVLGFDEVGGVPAYPSIFVSDGTILLTLWRAADRSTRQYSACTISRSPWDDDALEAAWAKVSAHPKLVVDVAPGPIRAGSATCHSSCYTWWHQNRVRDAVRLNGRASFQSDVYARLAATSPSSSMAAT